MFAFYFIYLRQDNEKTKVGYAVNVVRVAIDGYLTSGIDCQETHTKIFMQVNKKQSFGTIMIMFVFQRASFKILLIAATNRK